MKLVVGCDGGQDGRAPGAEERRGKHQQAAERVEQPRPRLVDGRDEPEGDDHPDQVGRDHHLAAVEAVEDHARHRRGKHRRHRPREHHAADDEAGPGGGERQAEDGDVVEVIADFRDHLAGPGVTVVAVVLEEAEKAGQAEEL